MPRRVEPRKGLFALLLLTLVASFLMLMWRVGTPPNELREVEVEPDPVPDAGGPVAEKVAKAPPRCRPRATQDCHDGDVWWFDGCGVAMELAEACGGKRCEEGHCAAPDPGANQCGTITAWGSCEGDVAQACVAGRVVSVDCSQQRERCVMTGEGVRCLPRDDKLACTGKEASSCNGDRLRLCVDGRWAEIDCGLRRASCASDGVRARCESDLTLALLLPNTELCDGKDNDDDLKVDEGAICDPVPLVAFVPTAAKLADLENRMNRELAILNAMFAPLRFRWAKTVPADVRYRVFDPDDIDGAARQLSQTESKFVLARTPGLASDPEDAGFDFYIPVLLSEKLKMDPPKSGLSTLPNATCGGVRTSDHPSPPHGLIVLSEARMPETLTHEMGHFLGLCHTHEDVSRFAVDRPGSLPCLRTGDGICDTPVDPGPNQCREQGPCDLYCPRSGARPDALNVMSYYLGCRRTLSSDQLAEVSRNLQLRRGWFRCLDPNDCRCDPQRSDSCPAAMSCHPGGSDFAAAWSCELDGPALPGGACRGTSQCSQGAICLVSKDGQGPGHCARACRDVDELEPGASRQREQAECSCADVGLPIRICAEDLGR